MSIDSGGNFHGYIGDLCRMGVLGEPDDELVDLLAEIESVQQAAFAKVAPGVSGGEMVAAGEAALRAIPSAGVHRFLRAWHGADQPRGAVPDDRTIRSPMRASMPARPLEPGMVLSVETTMLHPTPGLHQAGGHAGRDRDRHEMFGERGARLEPRRGLSAAQRPRGGGAGAGQTGQRAQKVRLPLMRVDPASCQTLPP